MIRIYQVELTAHCDLTCAYCPQPTMARKKGDMSLATYAKVLEKGSFPEGKVNLHHFGEPALFPHLELAVEMASRAGLSPGISTNGKVFGGNLGRISLLAEAGLDRVVVSTHILKEPAWTALVREFTDLGVTNEGSFYPMTPENRHDWSGQSKAAAALPPPGGTCPFLADNMYAVLWDGTVVSCCVDAEGATAMGNIRDVTEDSHPTNAHHDLCDGCSVRVPQAFWWRRSQ